MPVQRWILTAILIGIAFLATFGAQAEQRPIKIVALGDSLMAGYGLPETASFPSRLQAALRKRGHSVEIVNAGVSGDTASGGLARLDWSVPNDADAVILGLGANDMLRGIEPKVTRAALDSIVKRLNERNIGILLAGMVAAPNLGPDYAKEFNAIYPELAKAHDLVFYPFFLDGIAANAKLNLPDGIHPSAEGVGLIVDRLLPAAEELLSRIRATREARSR